MAAEIGKDATETVEYWISQAIDGNTHALERVVTAIQDDVYSLALRMLMHPEDARDATQEILIKIITKLSTFRGDCQFTTWVYRVASNHLLSQRRGKASQSELSFEQFQQDLESDLQDYDGEPGTPLYHAMLNELRVSCTMAMMLCLPSHHRMAYILGDILELDHQEASRTMNMAPDNFRKQLSRARASVVRFTRDACGLANACARCSCDRKLKGAVQRGRVQPGHVFFSQGTPDAHSDIQRRVNETTEALKAITLQRSVGRFKSPDSLGHEIQRLVEEGARYRPLHA